jgi:ABC-type microcin C transport system permease subunit YejE
MKLRANLVIGGSLFALAIVVGLLAPWLAHTDPVMDANLMNAEEPPSWTWWFGTDGQGRDIYSRVLYGARVSLTVGIVSQLINSVIGVGAGPERRLFWRMVGRCRQRPDQSDARDPLADLRARHHGGARDPA